MHESDLSSSKVSRISPSTEKMRVRFHCFNFAEFISHKARLRLLKVYRESAKKMNETHFFRAIQGPREDENESSEQIRADEEGKIQFPL